MATLYLNAPAGRTQQGTSNFYRTFDTILTTKIGPDYAIYSGIASQLSSGIKIVVCDKEAQSPRRAEGTMAGNLVLSGAAGNGARRYDVSIPNLIEVEYVAPPAQFNHWGVAFVP
jgi:hypothetical protein